MNVFILFIFLPIFSHAMELEIEPTQQYKQLPSLQDFCIQCIDTNKAMLPKKSLQKLPTDLKTKLALFMDPTINPQECLAVLSQKFYRSHRQKISFIYPASATDYLPWYKETLKDKSFDPEMQQAVIGQARIDQRNCRIKLGIGLCTFISAIVGGLTTFFILI